MADHTEINPVGLAFADHDIALVRVCMEGADIENLVNIIVDYGGAYALKVTALFNESVFLGDRAAVNEGHCEDALGCKLVKDCRAGNLLLVFYAVFFEELGVFSLNAEVELLH